MSFCVIGTNHTSFTVSSLDRTLPFFLKCLKKKLVSRAPRDPEVIRKVTGAEGAEMEIAFVSGHGCTVELVEYKAPASRRRVKARPCDAGFAHIAFNVDDADAAVADAAAYGVEAISEPVPINAGPNRSRKVLYCRDADGVTFEFIEVKT